MPRARTGQLIWRKSGWYARVWTTIDGERVRVCKALGTMNRAVAKRKLERLLAADNAKAEDAKRPETFGEAAERISAARTAEGMQYAAEDLASVRKYAVPLIGQMAAVAVAPEDINAVLDAAKAAGRSRQSVQNLKQRISTIFAALRREGVVKVNPVADATMPAFVDAVVRERATLTDAELAVYLAWQHPKKHFRAAVLERQVMSIVARTFGGLRTSDLHALRWEAFDVTEGAFAWGWAPRKKTRRPQLLEVPELLRPLLRDYWTRSGQPRAGLLFPVRRIGKRGNRVGEQRGRASHAGAFRRDLQAAFKAAIAQNVEAPAPGSQRWRELFEEGPYTLPVDFHSWRRAYAQALADADVNAQQAAALAGHADLAAHARYLRNAGKMRKLPAAALPALVVSERAPGTGSEPVSGRLLATGTDGMDTESAVETPANSGRRPTEPRVRGSNPLGRAEDRGSGENQQALALPDAGSEHADQPGRAEPEAAPADVVETALAAALQRAAAAQEWTAVEVLTRELTARREARAGVVELPSARKRRGPT